MERLQGVKRAEVSFQAAEAMVEFDPSQVTVDQMVDAVNRAGFKATVLRIQ